MTDPLLPCSAHSTIILAKVMRVLHSAASAHGDSEHSTAELDAHGASKATKAGKRQSSSGADGSLATRIGHFGPRRGPCAGLLAVVHVVRDRSTPYSASAGVGAVVTALVLIASRPSVSARAAVGRSVGDAQRARLWRIRGLVDRALQDLPFMPAQAFAAHGGRMALDVRFPRRADVSLRLLADEADRGRVAPLANETR